MSKIFSLLIFISISGAVLFSAGITINKSLKEKSNPVLIANLVRKINTSNQTAGIVSHSQVLAEETQNNCVTKISERSRETKSVVDLLSEAKIDNSYNNRAIMAKSRGIENYKGTSEQNIKLLSMLKNEFSCIKTDNIISKQ